MTKFHKFLFYSISLVSVIWACFALKTNPFELLGKFQIAESIKFIYILGITAIFWPIFYIEVCDLTSSAFGKNGKLYKSHFLSLKKDLIVVLVVALILLSIYFLDGVEYSSTSIDLGFMGIPFIVAAIYHLTQISRSKIAGVQIRKFPIIAMLAAIFAWGTFSYLTLLSNSSGLLETYQAIWFQITIICGSFFIYINTSLQLHLIKEQKFEISRFKKYFFQEVIRSKSKFYENLESPMEELNSKTRQVKARQAAGAKKRSPKRRKRR